MSKSPLPSFDRPPLEEVVFGIQFVPLEKFTAAQAGLFWRHVRDRYPSSEDQPPLPHQLELPDPQPNLEGQMVRFPLVPRSWFLSPDKTQLLQLQRDRFVRNWRRIDGTEQYPRFPFLLTELQKDWSTFVEYIDKESLGEITIDQCELNYINHIDRGDGWNSFSEIGNVFSFIKPTSRSGLLVDPETLTWSGSYKLPEGRGRLRVEMSPVFRGRDFKMTLSLTVRAAGAPAGTKTEDAISWFAMAHEWVVKAFDDLTDPAMHSIWKKTL